MEYGNIISVKPIGNFTVPEKGRETYEGYRIITSTGNQIYIGVDNQSCFCESWGSVMVDEDDVEHYTGAKVLKVNKVDTNKCVEQVEDLDCGGVMFMNVETDKGTLQFAVYNCHNGYYGHEAIIAIGDEVVEEETL